MSRRAAEGEHDKMEHTYLNMASCLWAHVTDNRRPASSRPRNPASGSQSGRCLWINRGPRHGYGGARCPHQRGNLSAAESPDGGGTGSAARSAGCGRSRLRSQRGGNCSAIRCLGTRAAHRRRFRPLGPARIDAAGSQAAWHARTGRHQGPTGRRRGERASQRCHQHRAEVGPEAIEAAQAASPSSPRTGNMAGCTAMSPSFSAPMIARVTIATAPSL